MSEQMSDEMGAPGYPAGDETTENEQGGGAGDGDMQPEQNFGDAGSSTQRGMDTEQAGGEGDLDDQNAEMIRRRAYEISQGPDAGSPEDNWSRAEAEIRTEQASP
jgi:hypothetical protein